MIPPLVPLLALPLAPLLLPLALLLAPLAVHPLPLAPEILHLNVLETPHLPSFRHSFAPKILPHFSLLNLDFWVLDLLVLSYLVMQPLTLMLRLILALPCFHRFPPSLLPFLHHNFLPVLRIFRQAQHLLRPFLRHSLPLSLLPRPVPAA